MKVKLLQEWNGKSVGAELELSDAKAKRLIATGLVERVRVAKKKAKPKESADGCLD